MEHTEVDEHHGHGKEKHCKHERAMKTWLETDYSPGVHRIALGEKYRYDCPDCKAIWEVWE